MSESDNDSLYRAERPPMSHLYHFEVDGLLETWLSALQDYDAGDFDTSVIDTKTAAKYEELLDTELDGRPTLAEIANVVRNEPQMISNIQSYCRYPCVAWNATTGQLETYGYGKGKDPVPADAGHDPDPTGRSEISPYAQLNEDAITCRRLLLMLKLREGRQSAWAQLMSMPASELEQQQAIKSLQNDHGPPVAAVLRSILHDITTFQVDGEDVGPLFTASHVSHIVDLRDVCSGISRARKYNTMDGKPLTQWLEDLWYLFQKAGATPDDDFLED